jgi:peptidylprolyl isomerase
VLSFAAACEVKEPFELAEPPATALKTASGISWEILKAGTGTIRPTLTSAVVVHYSGWTTDGEMFDSSHGRGEPATFGVTQVITGWTEILQLMVQGEKRRVWIPGHLAYDNSTRPDAPKGTLIFEMELLDIIQR